MDIPEFEEKQYEGALSHELAAGQPTAYASGQVLEALVGYDLALYPGEPKIWDLLDEGFPPGALLSSGLWSTAPRQPLDADLPQDLVSLILQVKRPHRLDHWRAGQHHYWKGPYFRFYVEEAQQAQLAALERSLASRALVRYGAAAFLTYDQLYAHQRSRGLADHSAFVSPRALVGHRLWSYARPGTHGYANPEGERAEADTWETLNNRAREIATSQTIIEHVRELAQIGSRDSERSDWLDRLLPPGANIGRKRRDAISSWGVFAGQVARMGAEWFVLDVTGDRQRDESDRR
jgi:hypothetical protein